MDKKFASWEILGQLIVELSDTWIVLPEKHVDSSVFRQGTVVNFKQVRASQVLLWMLLADNDVAIRDNSIFLN